MNSAEAKTIANFLCTDYSHEVDTTLRVLGAVPANHLDYSPDAKSKTALGLLRHLALEDEWLLNCVAAGAFTPPPDDSDACGILTPADAVAHYRARIPAAIERVRALTPEQLTQVLDMFGLMQMPAVQFLGLAVKHSVHHRGQLSTYLRAMGGAVPGIYGPSADSQPMAEAAAN
ncbi:DinB [Candidatus Koribacter versatilis Ellin345]|uniref:DinB n=1 Tax=Koribacter versatilis (strain Ellin345) TaxID=204669 RepID=Q1ISR4_KORVE|nr:DinB family protein [Candidatus Koribacter versatilis]ABF40086.1 DinB [Candidatus Koribacter versatilis Ellin345]